MLKRLFGTREDPTPRAANGERIYAVGDIHGRLDLLRELYGQVASDAAGASTPCTLVFLGDYADRGPDTAGVVDFLLDGDDRFRHVYLKGNHEALWQQFLTEPEVGPAWFNTGGVETVMSYGLREEIAGRSPDFARIAMRLADAMPDSHHEFLENLDLSYRSGDYVFAHAGIRPRVPMERQDPEDLIWIRKEFLGADDFDGLCVVHGHSQVADAVDLPHRIAVDTGAYHSGRLTCVVIEGEERRFLSTG
ncbi:MAG: serine/threonine protein phosphatase [Alphaproteobacteria bacterium]|nr:serine/threonine protein phosphatase [Alphaproteobacteria bacterium]